MTVMPASVAKDAHVSPGRAVTKVLHPSGGANAPANVGSGAASRHATGNNRGTMIDEPTALAATAFSHAASAKDVAGIVVAPCVSVTPNSGQHPFNPPLAKAEKNTLCRECFSVVILPIPRFLAAILALWIELHRPQGWPAPRPYPVYAFRSRSGCHHIRWPIKPGRSRISWSGPQAVNEGCCAVVASPE